MRRKRSTVIALIAVVAVLAAVWAFVIFPAFFAFNSEQDAEPVEDQVEQGVIEPEADESQDPDEAVEGLEQEQLLIEPEDIDPNWEPAEQDPEPIEVAPQDYSDALVVPRLGVRAPLLTMTLPENKRVFPPTHQEAYTIEHTNYGVPGDGEGTAYIALHSAWGIDAIGNNLIDIPNQEARIVAGDVIIADGYEYETVDVKTVHKPDLPDTDEVWQRDKDRLVLFFCLQLPNAQPSTHNIIVIAERVSE